MDARYTSPINRDVAPAARGEFAPLRVGPIELPLPVVLAPMAGITNYPFRHLCRRFGAALTVSEMITARALVEGNARTLELARFAPGESPRSLQLYGVDPEYVGRAVSWLVGEDQVDHIDLNFGCPVRKVTRRGGGAALPYKRRLFEAILRAAVKSAGTVPVSVKFRLGIDEAHLTFLDAGRIAQDTGCCAVALHARTAAELYSGEAHWERIAQLKQALAHIPVLGNGDIWEAADALRMLRATDCDGVVIGRGCLGRPWLFRDLVDVFQGREPSDPPCLGQVLAILREHASLLCAHFGERRGMLSLRKHSGWYTKGFPESTRLRERLARVTSLEALEQVLALADPTLAFPPRAMRMKRGKKTGRQRVALPEGYLEERDDLTPPGPEAEIAISGG